MNIQQTATHPGYMLMSPDNFDTIPRGSPSSPGIISSRPLSPMTTPLSPITTPISPNLTPSNKNKSTFYNTLQPIKHNIFDSNTADGIIPISAHTDMTDSGGSPTSPLTKREIKHLKKYNKEPLVNKSPTIHARRKAEYIDIDLPDTASEGSAGSYIYDIPTSTHELHSSTPSSTYDVPLLTHSSTFDVPSSTYDVPTLSRSNTTTSVQSSNYDVPRQSLYDIPPSVIRTLTPTNNNISNIPKSQSPLTQEADSFVRSSSTSPTHRALPHLPTDYENVKPVPKKLSNGGYVNIGYRPPVKPDIVTGLYMEVPLQEKPHIQPMNNIYSDIPERMESQLKIRRVESDQTNTMSTSNAAGLKIAKELEEDGYEFINPATLPALKSPPIVPSVDTFDDEDENDTYVEVNRTILQSVSHHNTGDGITFRKTEGSNAENIDFCKVMSRSKRLSDGYEEITDVVRELRERSPPLAGSVKGDRSASIISLEQNNNNKEKEDITLTIPSRSCSSVSSSESDRINTPQRLDTPPLDTPPLDRPRVDTPQRFDTPPLDRPRANTPQRLDTPPLDTPPLETTQLIFNGEIEEYNDNVDGDGDDCYSNDEDFEEISFAQINIDQPKERSSSDPFSPQRTRAVTISQDSKLVPANISSPDTERTVLLRKRSSTLGDILDGKEPKKHTYVNVPDDTLSPRLLSGDLPKNKPPMPLPRPQSVKTMPRQSSTTGNIIESCSNVNNSNNKVKCLVRQFSDV